MWWIAQKYTRFLPGCFKDFWNELQKQDEITKEGILNQFIWYNKNIKIKNNYVYSETFINKGVLRISDIYDQNNKIKSFKTMKNEFGLETKDIMLYNGIIAAIPKRWKSIIKSNIPVIIRNISCIDVTIGNESINFKSTKIKQIYNLLILNKKSVSKANIN